MTVPFCYGKIVSGENYTDRIEDARHLYNNFLALTNTTLISPRRWGKSSLVNRALELLTETTEDYIVIKLDAFNLKTREDFLEGYARSVSHAFTHHNELYDFAREVLPSSIESEVVVGNKDVFPVELRINLRRDKKVQPLTEIINLPQKLAQRKNKKVIVCIDEFQVVAEYGDSLAFQRTLRSCWQTHDKVAYCLFGSKYNLMTKLVGKPKMPLYKFGDMFYLQKISTNDWIDYIISQFERTGKSISVPTAAHLVELVENHSYYVQQLSQLVWFRTSSECSDSTVDEAFEGLVGQLSMVFTQTMEELRPTQCEFLRAVCDGVTKWNSAETLREYGMGTASNVKNHREALEKKEIITSFPGRVEIQDPVFKHWLASTFFKNGR